MYMRARRPFEKSVLRVRWGSSPENSLSRERKRERERERETRQTSSFRFDEVSDSRPIRRRLGEGGVRARFVSHRSSSHTHPERRPLSQTHARTWRRSFETERERQVLSLSLSLSRLSALRFETDHQVRSCGAWRRPPPASHSDSPGASSAVSRSPTPASNIVCFWTQKWVSNWGKALYV